MGNPDSRTPQPIIDKLCETVQRDKTHGYSASRGIYKLRVAIANWYKRKYGVVLEPKWRGSSLLWVVKRVMFI